MSDNPVCSRCENQVQTSWKYCRFCGNKLEISKAKPQQTDDMSDIDDEVETPDEVEFDRDQYYEILSTRAERSTILKKKQSIRDEIDSLLEQLKAGLIGEDTVLPKIKELKNQVKEINKQNRSYSDIPDELPIEVLNDQITAAKQRLRKIDKLKSDENLGKDTIREAKERTQQSLELLQDQQSKIFGHLRTWKKELENKIKEARKEIEMLYVRYKTDEITEDTYKEKKENLVKNIETDEEVANILDNILRD